MPPGSRSTEGPALLATRALVLVLPTYGGHRGRGSVPKQVIRFLNDPRQPAADPRSDRGRQHKLRGQLLLAGDIIAAKCQVPHLYRFELMGTPEDVDRVQQGLEEFWTRLSQTQQ